MTSNPLDDLRQINREQREAQELPPDTALREPVSTGALSPVRPHGRKAVRKEGSTEGIPPARKEGRKGGREEALTQGRQDVLSDLRAHVRNTVSEKRVYQGGVKATLDLAPDLSKRFKRYSIDHHNVTLRQLMTELLDAYLQGEGY